MRTSSTPLILISALHSPANVQRPTRTIKLDSSDEFNTSSRVTPREKLTPVVRDGNSSHRTLQ
ncbi:hypothetical protein J6590_040396 [Homalodisca vitripennis]|nr:hypothetical protein J6590_040396 [Homalodisca vitripennis]